jgi:hypothetical protein
MPSTALVVMKTLQVSPCALSSHDRTRDNDLVLAAQAALGLTDAELDALWDQAAAIK